jgi:hypothetical protein
LAKLYRFFLGAESHFAHGLHPASPPAFGLLAARHDYGSPGLGYIAWSSGGHPRADAIEFVRRLLLPLRGFPNARRLYEDVRDAEVCITVVGDDVRETSAEGAN